MVISQDFLKHIGVCDVTTRRFRPKSAKCYKIIKISVSEQIANKTHQNTYNNYSYNNTLIFKIWMLIYEIPKDIFL